MQTTGVKFAIVGCGLVGRKRFTSLPSDSLLVACDSELSRAESIAGGSSHAIATTDLTQVLESEAQAIIVAITNALLAPVTARALRAGKAVLVEKPGAISTRELDELITLSRDTGLPVRVGYNHRYHPALQKARELVDDDAVGPLMFIRGRYGHGGRLGYNREWRADPKLSGGGELIDQGVHLIDLAGWFLGAFTVAEGQAATYFWDMPVDDNAFVSLRTAANQVAWLHVSCTEWKNLFSFEIYGRTGKLHVEGLGGSYGVERLSYYKMSATMGPPETTTWEYPRGDDSWSLEMEAFLEDIRLERTPVPGLKEARAAMEVVEKIYRSSGYLKP
jgi:Predicted dehydrogenases and related proteins